MTDEAAWTRIENGIGSPEAPMWWHKVNDQAVSLDAGQTYYLMNEPLTTSGDPVIYDVDLRPVPNKEELSA